MARELQSQLTDSQRDEQRRKQLHDEVSIPSVISCRSGVGSTISMLLICLRHCQYIFSRNRLIGEHRFGGSILLIIKYVILYFEDLTSLTLHLCFVSYSPNPDMFPKRTLLYIFKSVLVVYFRFRSYFSFHFAILL